MTTLTPPRADVPVLPDLSIRQLEYLVAVADSPTWASAAAAVGVSPSALSQGLAELERRLGVTIFDRDGRRRLIRESALPVVAHARQVLGLTGDLAAWSHRLRTGASGRVRVGMIDAAALVHLPEAVQSFRRDRPDVALRLRVEPSAQLIDQLLGGQLDLVVCVEPPRPVDGIVTEPLRDEALVVHAPPETTIGEAGSWGPWVLFPTGSHTRTIVEAELRARGASIDVVAESHQPEVLQELVQLGAGWTVLPDVSTTGRRRLERGPVLASRKLVIASRTGTIVDPAADELADRFRHAP